MGNVLFYTENGEKQDAALHGAILADGDAEAALQVSRDVLRELGIEDDGRLIPKAPSKDE
jgi:hypothetical protein